MKIYQVDAFTQTRFKGNPAAVIILDEWLDAHLMQQIAQENNLAETAFLKKITVDRYQIRWFSPTHEVDFCGHATLASAFILFKTGINQITFDVKNLGQFFVTQELDGKINMNFPSAALEPIETPPEIAQAFKQPFKQVYLSEQAYVVEYLTKEDLQAEQPDFAQLKAFGAKTHRDFVITTAGDANYDCYSRYFAPAIGIEEDPVTGSIHTVLVPFWANKLNKTVIHAYQASKRGGELFCRIIDQKRVEISGYGVLYLEGHLRA